MDIEDYKNYNITCLELYDSNLGKSYIYNVFDKSFKHLVSISCKNKEDFEYIFDDYKLNCM